MMRLKGLWRRPGVVNLPFTSTRYTRRRGGWAEVADRLRSGETDVGFFGSVR
jgi:hypothetical protein